MATSDFIPSTSYKVQITRTERRLRYTKEWLRLHDDANGPMQYGYVESDVPRKEEILIYSQALDAIDLPAVISAVNQLNVLYKEAQT